jgi:hypothetical protein
MGEATPERERIQRLRDAIVVIAIDKRSLVLDEKTDAVSANSDEAAKQDTLEAAIRAWREGHLGGSLDEVEQAIKDLLRYP